MFIYIYMIDLNKKSAISEAFSEKKFSLFSYRGKRYGIESISFNLSLLNL